MVEEADQKIVILRGLVIYRLVPGFLRWMQSDRDTVLKFYYPFAPVLNPDLGDKLQELFSQ